MGKKETDKEIVLIDDGDMSLSVDPSEFEPTHSPFKEVGVDTSTTFEGSLSFDVRGQTVVCPACDYANSVPRSPLLSVLTDEPIPCVECGYLLL